MKQVLVLAGLLLLLTNCAPRVVVNSASNVDFSKYRTYAWMDSDVKAGQNPLYYNQIATQNVENIINQALTQRGLKQTRRRPDMLIGYHFFVEEKTRTVNVNPGPVGVYGPYYGWGRWGYRRWRPGWWGYNFNYNQYVQEPYAAGTLVMDMVDARTHQLIWRGSVQDAVANPANIGEQLTQQVQNIVEKFPARQT